MTEPLTERQSEVLDALRSYMAEHAYAPTISELCAMVGTSSRGAMVDRLRQLEYRKIISRTSSHRGIKLLPAAGCCPHCGGAMKQSEASNGGTNAKSQETNGQRLPAIQTGPNTPRALTD